MSNCNVIITVINASHQFLHGTTSVPVDEKEQNSRTRVTKMLCMTANPEEKRKIIGDVFVEVSNNLDICFKQLKYWH